MSTELEKSSSGQALPFVKNAMENLASLMELGDVILGSKMAPAHFYETDSYNKPDFTKPKIGTFVQVILHGHELGLSMSASMQDIVPVKGRMSVMGDAAKALAFSSGLIDTFKETVTGSIKEQNLKYEYYLKRKDGTEFRRSFSVEDAKKAGLWVGDDADPKHKFGVWFKFPERMIMYRGLGFILRDGVPEVFKGTSLYEELLAPTETLDQEAIVVDETKATGSAKIASGIVERVKVKTEKTIPTPQTETAVVVEDEPIDKILTRLNYVKKVSSFILDDENLPEKLKAIHEKGGDSALIDYIDSLSHIVVESVKSTMPRGEMVVNLFPFELTEVQTDEHTGEPNGEPRNTAEVKMIRQVFKSSGLTQENFNEMHTKAGVTNYDSNISLCEFGSIKQLNKLLSVLNESGK
jgi:hypothetical protein